MIKKQFSILIDAPRNVVWHALWDDHHYRTWTKVFVDGSYAVSDWKKGDDILFLDGQGRGMYSVIEELQEPSSMVFRHLGDIADGKKQDPAAWAGSHESYTLSEVDTHTELTVVMDTLEDMADYFDKTWPQAMHAIKHLAESNILKKITVKALVQAPMEKVWTTWTEPEYIMQWNFASDDWHCPAAVNDLRVGGKFLTKMAARDGSFGFEFGGIYDQIITHELISYHLEDGRTGQVYFKELGDKVQVTEVFDPETQNPIALQKTGWQTILDNFKKFVEATV